MKNLINKFTFRKPKRMVGPVFWIFIENFFMVFPGIAVYYVINILVDGYSDNSLISYNDLWIIAFALLVIFLIQFILSTITFLRTFIPSTKDAASNKKEFINKLRNIPLGYFQKKESGEIINTFTGDFLAVQQSMVGAFTGIFSVILAAILTGIFMFMFNPLMALSLYICIPITIIVIYISMKVTTKLSMKNVKARDLTATYLNEYLLGMKTLRSYNQVGEGFKKLKKAYDNLMKSNIHSETVGGSLMSLASTLIKLGLPLMCFTGAYLLLGGKLLIADYLALIIIGTKILSPLVTWVQYMILLKVHYISASRIDSVMSERELSGINDISEFNSLDVKNISFSYDNNVAVNNVSFNIKKNSFTAIVGASGSGKSTILKLLTRFYDIDEGVILCNNKNIKDINPESWMNLISMVLQDTYLFNETVKENILFGREDISDDKLVEVCKKACCHDFIMKLENGYDTVIGEGGNTLSGGEKQRITIARAILKDAPLLFLDEPTSSLDARNEVLIQQAILELVKGRTIVMIAHRLKTVVNADLILVMEENEIKERGTHSELLSKKGIYYNMWNKQTESETWSI